jgi:hypothetical protein
MYLQYRSISLDNISPSTKWNLHPWALKNCPELLLESLKEIGVIFPPLILETEDHFYQVVSGYRRIEFTKKHTSIPHIDCRVVQSGIAPHLLFNIILKDQTSSNSLTLAEKAMFLLRASEFFPKDKLASMFFNDLGIKRKQSFVDDLLTLLGQKQAFIEQVDSGLIEEQMLTELLRLKESDRGALLSLFNQLNLGTSKQKRMLSLLRDAAYKSGSTLHQYLDNEDIQSILADINLNIPQKISHLDRFLQLQIFPQILAAENDFAAEVKKINLNQNQQITHTQAFEKDTVTLATEFQSLDECRSFLEKMNSK